MMNWEDKIKELSNYNIAFEIREGYYHISIIFQDGWDVILPESENIYVEKRNDAYHYIASIDTVNLNDIFACIESTIDYNKDLERKLELFKEKTIELQEIFSNESYDKLKTIEFTFPKEKKKTKKKKETKTENIVEKEKSEEITAQPTNKTYDTKEEVVIMKDGEYLEELEK